MMVPIDKVYPGVFEDGEEIDEAVSDYDPLILSMGYEVVLQMKSEDYQGDTYILFKNGERYGIGSFSWGSCSVCDELKACESYAEIDALRQRIHDAIRWGTREETLLHLRTHDWNGDAAMDRKLQHRFVRRAIAALTTPNGG